MSLLTERLDLEERELLNITGRKQPAAQARVMKSLRVPFSRRPDGSLLVGREAMRRALAQTAGGIGAAASANGLNWSKTT